MPFQRAPRLVSFDYLGPHRYFLTICTHKRRRLFVGHDAVAPVLSQLSYTAAAQAFAVSAYCFMPDHFHSLMEGTEPNSDFRQFVRLFKQRSSFRWNKSHETQLWQRSYFERVLRSEESTLMVARYILANPVRGGLVRSPEDYRFSGSLTIAMCDLLASF
jgi:REP-associated tyrosine transposase